MKVKITDFLIEMGKICDEHSDSCSSCPLCEHGKYFYGCLKDYMSNPNSAKKIKDITINHMKG